MDDKTFKRSAFIVAGLVLVAILLWFLHNRAVVSQQDIAQTPPYSPSSPVDFIIQGPGGPTPGPMNFPSAVYNIIAGGPGNPGTLKAGNCSCGCDGSGGNTTVNFQLPGFQDLVNQLAARQAATLSAAQTSAYAAMGYTQAVFVSDNTRTLFSGGNPF